MEATKHEGMYQPPLSYPVWHNVADAAKALGVSESAVRRACRKAGVKRIRGPVAGMVELTSAERPRPGYLSYSE